MLRLIKKIDLNVNKNKKKMDLKHHLSRNIGSQNNRKIKI
jgi:ribosomal protein L32